MHKDQETTKRPKNYFEISPFGTAGRQARRSRAPFSVCSGGPGSEREPSSLTCSYAQPPTEIWETSFFPKLDSVSLPNSESRCFWCSLGSQCLLTNLFIYLFFSFTEIFAQFKYILSREYFYPGFTLGSFFLLCWISNLIGNGWIL